MTRLEIVVDILQTKPVIVIAHAGALPRGKFLGEDARVLGIVHEVVGVVDTGLVRARVGRLGGTPLDGPRLSWCIGDLVTRSVAVVQGVAPGVQHFNL